MKKILITGGSGFIGSNFVRKIKFYKNIQIYFFYRKKKIYKKKAYIFRLNMLYKKKLYIIVLI